MLSSQDPMFIWANRGEACLWIALACLLVSIGRFRRRLGRHAWFAAGALAAFGVSDLVEASTGAWWKPWWLLAWKAGCIGIIVGLVLHARHRGSGPP